MEIRRKIWLTFLAILVLAALAGIVDWPKGPDIHFKKIDRELKLRLGLDLQGGSQLLYEADLSKVAPENFEEAMAGIRDVIERRVNALGVTEPVVQTNKTEGKWRVQIELAGVFDINKAISMIGQTPSLDFREQSGENPQEILSKKDITIEEKDGKVIVKNKEGRELLSDELSKLAQQENFLGFKLTKLSGQHLTSAQMQFNQQTNLPIVSLQFNDEGKKLFAEITERNVGKPLAIFLDGQMISQPVVREAIRDGQAVISGNFTMEEAKQLAMRLNAGALPVPIYLVSQTNIGASLGKDSVQKSFIAGVLGLILVALFMIIYYRLPGLLSVFALMIYAAIVLALFKLIPVTMTLAGVAGFIVSIGMAVDANVLIFERTKEMLRLGKTLETSVEEGFKHAWNSIRDSNVSSLITCFILAWFGTSIIKGFAITLAIGVLVSMFSAITITRTLLRLILPWVKKWRFLFM
ncbi:MAG: protein translocase subunit SecD [Patescibacteria group bacterium]